MDTNASASTPKTPVYKPTVKVLFYNDPINYGSFSNFSVRKANKEVPWIRKILNRLLKLTAK